ncbi:hypothetical protein [Niveibacterium sp. SC-1]|uniref:hypothetical protein n=1 Tax=Niveibacterium sp. SC-1 TaxID=3135646 RepID=UPI00311F7D08
MDIEPVVDGEAEGVFKDTVSLFYDEDGPGWRWQWVEKVGDQIRQMAISDDAFSSPEAAMADYKAQAGH